MPSADPAVIFVVAMARNGVIGRNGVLPWHLPEDLRHFKRLTLGKPVLMGRRTYESIGKPLPGRENLVLTRSEGWNAAGVVAVHSLDQAISRARGASELAVIGGAEIFELCMPLVVRIYLTRVDADLEGDAVFPALDLSEWRESDLHIHPADERNAYAMSFVTLDRRPAGR